MKLNLIVDLEATCWERSSDTRRGQNETIEIGAVLMEGSKKVGEFQSFIEPKLHPELSDFCKELTSIRQEDVDGAPGFADALQKLVQYAEETSGARFVDIVFSSWGNYDANQFRHDCVLHNVPYPFGTHVNLKAEFGRIFKCKPPGMKRALEQLKLPLTGVHHRGIDDARNIAEILKVLLQVGLMQ